MVFLVHEDHKSSVLKFKKIGTRGNIAKLGVNFDSFNN